MNKFYVGIDPGKNGGVVVLDNNKNCLGTYEIPKIGNDIDLNGFYEIFEKIKSQALNSIAKIHVCTESVHAIFGSSAQSTFSFGYVVGIIDMLIISNKLPYSKIQPKEWQKNIWLESEIEREPDKIGLTKTIKGKIKTKVVSLKAAKRLFPEVNFYPELKNGKFAKNPHDGIIDAILIAEACRRLNY